MAIFIVRVELHDAEGKHYDILHEQMALGGFKKTIKARGGKTYSLPTAEYSYEGAVTSGEEIRDMAIKAATEAVKTIVTSRKIKFMILVSKVEHWWGSLPPV